MKDDHLIVVRDRSVRFLLCALFPLCGESFRLAGDQVVVASAFAGRRGRISRGRSPRASPLPVLGFSPFSAVTFPRGRVESQAATEEKLRRSSLSSTAVSIDDVPVHSGGDEEGAEREGELPHEAIRQLCDDGDIPGALRLLDEAEERIRRSDFLSAPVEVVVPAPIRLEERSYVTVMRALADQEPNTGAASACEGLLARMKDLSEGPHPSCTPTWKSYDAVALAWSRSHLEDAGERCYALLEEQWSRYRQLMSSLCSAADPEYAKRFVPRKSCYVAALTAWARSRRGREAAEKAEMLLEEMESLREEHPSLAPTTICVNIVLSAWARSGSTEAPQRCESILRRMEELFFRGRTELRPTTVSFNTVMDTLSRGRQRGRERRAEALLERMEELSSSDVGLQESCQPDQTSFNTVLNCWARSRDRDAARRADAILRHMERRHADGSTDVQPDAATYNTVMTAWARSGDREAADRAERVLRRMDDAYCGGNAAARPNAITHNIIINVLAKSGRADAGERAMEAFRSMKRLWLEDGREDCRPDVFSYTGLIDAMAKQGGQYASDTAEGVLEELEEDYRRTGDEGLKPNIRTYTAVIHAIARSRSRPRRAEKIVERLEDLYETGVNDFQPDVVCYDALINAFGWSKERGRALKCFEIYQKMVRLFESRNNPSAKPDIVTCNSVLNAFAYDDASNDLEQAEFMEKVVETMEFFQSNAPAFGIPNHITFANVLLSISKHMPPSDRRTELAEATFWQCCRDGHVSVLVITNLRRAVPWERFSALLGPALLSPEGEPLRFKWKRLPGEWTRLAPKPKERRESRPSRKSPGVQVSKRALAKLQRGNSSDRRDSETEAPSP